MIARLRAARDTVADTLTVVGLLIQATPSIVRAGCARGREK